ncbi:MAG TPA: hypothetical protein VMU04_10905 [Candidatus Acidoferrum sp.]|nr:hypothetical protein [Candidatus Acidoferrum sp.]
MKSACLPVLVATVAALACLAVGAWADPLDNWTTTQVSGNYFGLRSVAYANGRYVAVGGYSDWGVILSSEDGRNWVVRELGGIPGGSCLAFAEAVIYAGGQFVVVGFWGGTAVSADGITWSVGNVPSSPADGLYGVTYGNGLYVAVGGPAASGDLNVFTSADGQNWAAQHSTSPVNASLGDVAFGAGRFVALGINRLGTDDSGHVYTSGDGTNWTRNSISGGSQVSYCNGRFLIPAGPGVNLLSGYGTAWAAQATGVTTLLGKVVYCQGAFLARAGAYLAASADGRNWVQYPQWLPGTSVVVSDGQRLLTVGNNTLPFVPVYASGYTYLSDPVLAVRMSCGRPPTLAISGLVGWAYRIDATDALAVSGANQWQTLTSVQLTNTTCVWTDGANLPARFYRVTTGE